MIPSGVAPYLPDAVESVVLLDPSGRVIGHAEKATVHTADTPLHLAFSCYVFNDKGEVLLSRRSLAKVAWPGVWTNSFCGHPAPGESFESAITRRALGELGLQVEEISSLLPDFRYRATDASGVVENEICPVFRARAVSDLSPNADEVAETAWVRPTDLAAAVRATPFAFSPWLVWQSEQLEFLR